MLKSDFFYELPTELIAQTPVSPRDSSRLLKINRATGELLHSHFYELNNFLQTGDLLVLNDSRVFPARLFGKKRGSSVDVEFLLFEQKGANVWETAVRPGRRLKKGAVVDFNCGLSAEVVETVEGGNRLVRFSCGENPSDFFALLKKIGQTPLPPYITEKLSDPERYNTIYSRETGSSAAPTAGLHFTENTFAALAEKGVETAFVTLHVGLGTFRPVKTENILDHKMHSEHFVLPPDCAEKINKCKERGGRVIAAGTTSCRTLESAARHFKGGKIQPLSANTDIFIYPGYEFKITDGLLTNFHLPESTLIMLVSAFLGREKTLSAYNEAIKEKYRFFSFGDCCLII